MGTPIKMREKTRFSCNILVSFLLIFKSSGAGLGARMGVFKKSGGRGYFRDFGVGCEKLEVGSVSFVVGRLINGCENA